MHQFPGEPDRHPNATVQEMTHTPQGPDTWTQPQHDSMGKLIHNTEQPAAAIEVPGPEPIDHFMRVFDEHMHVFFTNYVNRKRRIAIAVPVFAGSTSLSLSGPGYILGYSLQGAAGKLATFSDTKNGYAVPILSVGFDARTTNTESFTHPLFFDGQIIPNLNDPSIQGVLYIEKTISD